MINMEFQHCCFVAKETGINEYLNPSPSSDQCQIICCTACWSRTVCLSLTLLCFFSQNPYCFVFWIPSLIFTHLLLNSFCLTMIPTCFLSDTSACMFCAVTINPSFVSALSLCRIFWFFHLVPDNSSSFFFFKSALKY